MAATEAHALLVLAIACAVAAVSTPVVGRLARGCGVVDQPSERKVNRRPDIPLLGGLAVALGLVVGLLVVSFRTEGVFGGSRDFSALLAGGSLLLLVGVVDDRFGLTALPKLVAQIVAAGLAIAHGFQVEYVAIPVLLETWWLPEWLSWLVSGLFIVGVTNSINLLDGMDGIATGVVVIIAGALTTMCWLGGQTSGLFLGVAFVGALLGFFPFNYPPARIFLGDTGALFIGYTLALLALDAYQQAAFVPFIVPLLALSVPIMDTSLSILRRLRVGKRIFAADRQHMHHRMLELFGSQRAAAHQMYGITFIFCLIAVFITRLRGYWFVLYLLLVIALTLKMVHNLGLFDIERSEEGGTDSGMATSREGR